MDPKKAEFIRLFEKTGWTQAELARRLGKTAGGVNGIIKGETVPDESTLRLMKFVVVSENVDISDALNDRPAVAPWAQNLVNELAALPEKDRDELAAQFASIVKRMQPDKKRGAKY